MYTNPVRYFDDGDEDIDPSFIDFYYYKEFSPDKLNEFSPDKLNLPPTRVWLRNRKDFFRVAQLLE